MCIRTKEGLKVLFSLQAELGCRVLSEFQCQGRNCHNFQSCIRSRCGVYIRPHRQEGGYESRGNKSNRTYRRQLSLSVLVCLLLDAAELEFCGPFHKDVCRESAAGSGPCPAMGDSPGCFPWPNVRAGASSAGGVEIQLSTGTSQHLKAGEADFRASLGLHNQSLPGHWQE